MIIELLTRFIKWTNGIGQPKRQEKSYMQPESISAIKIKPKKEVEVYQESPWVRKENLTGTTKNKIIERETGVSNTLGTSSTSMANSNFNKREFAEDLKDILMGGNNINPVDITNNGYAKGYNMPGHRNAPPPPAKKKSKAK